MILLRHNRNLVLFVTVLYVLLVASLDATPLLKKVALVHRHGARSGMGVVDGQLICSGDQYCQLTDYGKEMCLSLGRYVNETLQYPQKLGFPNVYNVSFMHSTATEYGRVVVSAEAVVKGIYNGQDALPFVDFRPKDADVNLVMWHSWPTWVIRATYSTELNEEDDYVRQLIGASNLTFFGEYFGLQDICENQPTECISFVQDSIACNVSAGLPVEPSFLLDNWDTYRTVISRFLSRILAYRREESDYSAQIGSLGHPLMQDILQFFTGAVDPTSPTSEMRMKHYAAHDWTLIALYSTLGIWTPPDMGNPRFVPRFAETIVLEYYEDAEAGGAGSVRAIWGYPTQAPPNFVFDLQPAPFQCLNTVTNVAYNASAATGCPVEDLAAYVNTSAPQAPDGICYATHDMLKAQDCLGDEAPPAGSRCLFYRKNCPNEDCGRTSGAIADPANGYACQTNQLNKGTSYYAATIIALVAPSLLGGAIAGFYGADKLRCLLWGSRSGAADKVPLSKGEQI